MSTHGAARDKALNIMDEKKIARINELYRRKKDGTITEAEMEEQQKLRREYIDSIRRNLRGQLDNIDVVDKDGSVYNLGERYDNKGKS